MQTLVYKMSEATIIVYAGIPERSDILFWYENIWGADLSGDRFYIHETILLDNGLKGAKLVLTLPSANTNVVYK